MGSQFASVKGDKSRVQNHQSYRDNFDLIKKKNKMPKYENTNIYLDLDETMLGSVYAQSNTYRDNLIEKFKFKNKFKYATYDDYLSFKWPHTDELVAYAIELVGVENVYVLTAATEEYAECLCAKLGIGISKNNIFAREHFACGVPKLKGKNNILVDNENYEYHSFGSKNKLTFLYDLPKSKLVQVMHFYPSTYFDDPKRFEKLKEDIITAIES